MRTLYHSIRFLPFLCLSLLAVGQERPQHPGGPVAWSPAIVIGFVGGFVRHDDLTHSPVQLAVRLREDYPTGVYVEVFENRRREDARQKILRLLDANQDGTLTAEEKQHARIIIYGISWGASESIELARELGKDGIPVLLTVQVDSIAKSHE